MLRHILKYNFKFLPKKNILAGENVLTGLGAENVVAGTQHIFLFIFSKNCTQYFFFCYHGNTSDSFAILV